MDVIYEPGEIKVIAYDNNGYKWKEKIVKTADKPHHLVLEADRNTLIAILTVKGSGLKSTTVTINVK